MTTTPDYAAYAAQAAAYEAQQDATLPANKAALFAALAAAGIHTVVVEFDGCGDSGQIEGIGAFNAANEATDLPNASVEMKAARYGEPALSTTTHSVTDAIETIAYDLLARTHNGWENNDGAYGTFTFSVAGHSISLDHHERFTDTTNTSHAF